MTVVVSPCAGATTPAPTGDTGPRLRAKAGEGVTVSTADGRFALTVQGRIQVRYDLNIPHAEGADTSQTIQIRRARLVFKGNVFSRHIKYLLQLGLSPRDQLDGLAAAENDPRTTPLRDAVIEFDHLRDLTLRVGQMKVPFSSERVMSSGKLSLVDRSAANAQFNLDRDIGLALLSRDLGGFDRFGYSLGIFSGRGRNGFAQEPIKMLYVARVAFRPLGKFDESTATDFARGRSLRCGLGVAYAFQHGAIADRGVFGEIFADRGTSDFHHLTADVLAKWLGLSLMGSVQWRVATNRQSGDAVDEEGNPIPLALPRSGLGWFAQLGWLPFSIPLELVARYSMSRNPYPETESGLLPIDAATGGINVYFAEHNLKLQVDYTHAWGAGIDPEFIGDLDAIRAQLQLAF